MAIMAAVLAPASVLAQPLTPWCTVKAQALASAANELTTAQNNFTKASNRATQAWLELQTKMNFDPAPGPGGFPPPGAYAYAEAHSQWQEANLQLQRAQSALEGALADRRQVDALARSCPATQ